MKTRTSLLALTLTAVGTCALAESPLDSSWSSTGAAPSTFAASHDTTVMGGAPARSAGLSRADVIADVHEARRAGMLLPAGEAIGYPFPMKSAPPVTAAAPQESGTQVLGGPPRDGITLDGYRFIGGEAGYQRVR